MEGVTNRRVEMMAQRKREKMSSRMRRRSISEDWISCARHSRCQKVVDVEGKAGRCCHRHCPDATSSVNRNYLLPIHFISRAYPQTPKNPSVAVRLEFSRRVDGHY